MSGKLAAPETRICEECCQPFDTFWAQRLCNPCRYEHASRDTCASCGAKTGHSGRTICGPCRYGTPPEMHAMTGANRAWIAAIIEGEGTFARTRRPCGLIRVAMTDLDVVERLKNVTGLGLVHDRGRRLAHHKDVWDWAVTRRENVCTLTEEIAPILLGRRRASAESVLWADGRIMPLTAVMLPGEPESWAWVAGLIEGDGWISPAPGGAARTTVVGVESTDLDVIERLACLTKAGHINELRVDRAHHKPRWRWTVHGRDAIRRVLTGTLPLLGERRTARAEYVLGVINAL
jgi:hypothetical protein